jgi:hypothetical protein
MFRRICFSALAAKRSFSIESPKILLAKNLVALRKIGESKNEAELTKAIHSENKIDLANLPEELLEFQPLLVTAAPSAPFVPDAKAWHNLKFTDMVIREFTTSVDSGAYLWMMVLSFS